MKKLPKLENLVKIAAVGAVSGALSIGTGYGLLHASVPPKDRPYEVMPAQFDMPVLGTTDHPYDHIGKDFAYEHNPMIRKGESTYTQPRTDFELGLRTAGTFVASVGCVAVTSSMLLMAGLYGVNSMRASDAHHKMMEDESISPAEIQARQAQYEFAHCFW